MVEDYNKWGDNTNNEVIVKHNIELVWNLIKLKQNNFA